jgi:hypothetical protein
MVYASLFIEYYETNQRKICDNTTHSVAYVVSELVK